MRLGRVASKRAGARSTEGSDRSRRAQGGDRERPIAARAFVACRRAIGRGLSALVFPVLAAGIVSCVMLIGMFPARSYVEQKEVIGSAQAHLAQLTAENRRAADELARLNTDTEIEQVAREQYGLVRPGEEVYHVMPAPQDPIAVPDAWPFDGMRKKMKAQPPNVIDPNSAAPTTATSTTATTSTPPGADVRPAR